jgi:polyhydroxyalkanoate synthesis regulator protein
MESKWVEVTFALDPDDYRLLKKYADSMEWTVPSLIRRNIEDFLRKQDELFKRGTQMSFR